MIVKSQGVVRILSIDPGKVNIAYAVIDARHHRGKVQIKLHQCGMLKKGITELKTTDVRKPVAAFHREIRSILETYGNFDLFIAERFQSRGLLGATSEYVNIGLGIVLVLTARKRMTSRLITAATWKNRANKFFDLKQAYKDVRTTPHELDATLIGIFGACSVFNQIPFKEHSDPSRLLQSINKKTTSPLKKRIRKRGK